MFLLNNSNSLPKIFNKNQREYGDNLTYHKNNIIPIINSVKQNNPPNTRFTVNVLSTHQENSLKVLSPFYNKNHYKSPEKCQCYVHRMKRIKLVQQLQKTRRFSNSRMNEMKQYQDKIVSILRDQHSLNKKLITQQQNNYIQIHAQRVKKIKHDYLLYINKREISQKEKIESITQLNRVQQKNNQIILKERLQKMYSLDHHNVPFQQILLKRNMNELQKKRFVKKVLGFLKYKTNKDNNFVKNSRPFIQNYLKPIFKKMQISQIIELTSNIEGDSSSQNNNLDPLKIEKISRIMNTTHQNTICVLNDIKLVLQQLKIFQEQNRKLRQQLQKERIQRQKRFNQQKQNQTQNQKNSHFYNEKCDNLYYSSNNNCSNNSNQNFNEQNILNNTISKQHISNQSNLQSTKKYSKKTNQQSKNTKSLKSSKNNSAKRKNNNKNKKQEQNQSLKEEQTVQSKPPFFQDWMLPKQVKKKQISSKYKNIKFQEYCSKQTFQDLAFTIDDIAQENDKVTLIYNKLSVKKILLQEETIEDLIQQFKPMFTEESIKLFRQMVIKDRTQKLLQKLNKQIDQGINRINKQKVQYQQNYIQEFQLPQRKQTQQSVSQRFSNNSVHKNSPFRRMSSVSRILRISKQIITQQIGVISQKNLDQSIHEVKQEQNYCSRIVYQSNKQNSNVKDPFQKVIIDPQKCKKHKEVLKYMKKKHNKAFKQLNQSFNSLSFQVKESRA